MSDWFQLDKEYMMSTYCRTKLTIERGEGCKLYDVDGKEYIDLFSGVGVNVLGYNHPKIVQTTMDQVTKSLHLPFHFLNPVAIEYAKKLVDCSLKNGKVFFTNSGTEATETTLKLIDKYRAIMHEEREGIVVLKNSFHGRTLGALHFTRQESVYQNFPKTSIPVYEVERENIEQLEETIIHENPIAIMLEPVLGSGEFIHYRVNIYMVFKIYVRNIMYYLSLMKFKVVWGERENYLLIKISILHHILFKLVKEQEAGYHLAELL